MNNVLAGNRRTVTWTVTLEDGSAPIAAEDVAVLLVEPDGTAVELDADVTPTDTGAVISATVRFEDDIPRGRYTVRLDIDDTDGAVFAAEAVFQVQAAAAERPEEGS